jgi:hypothetical protein
VLELRRRNECLKDRVLDESPMAAGIGHTLDQRMAFADSSTMCAFPYRACRRSRSSAFSRRRRRFSS